MSAFIFCILATRLTFASSDPETLRWFVGPTYARVKKSLPLRSDTKIPALLSEEQLEDIEDDARSQVLRTLPLGLNEYRFGVRQIRRMVVSIGERQRHLEANVSVMLLLNISHLARASLKLPDLDLSGVTEVRHVDLKMLKMEFPRVSDSTFMAGRDVERVWDGFEDLHRRILIDARRFRSMYPTLHVNFVNGRGDAVVVDIGGGELNRLLGGCGRELDQDLFPPLRLIRGGRTD